MPEGAPADWAGRTMVCRSLRMVPVECVARGYLDRLRAWSEYERDRTVCGLALPEGLVDGSELPAPIFTPATKAEVGEHDENVSYEEVARQVGAETAAPAAPDHPRGLHAGPGTSPGSAGIILADTKFEFGFGDARSESGASPTRC